MYIDTGRTLTEMFTIVPHWLQFVHWASLFALRMEESIHKSTLLTFNYLPLREPHFPTFNLTRAHFAVAVRKC